MERFRVVSRDTDGRYAFVRLADDSQRSASPADGHTPSDETAGGSQDEPSDEPRDRASSGLEDEATDESRDEATGERPPDDAYESVRVGITDESLPAVEPGAVVRATLDWQTSGPATVTELTVERRDRYRFVDGVDGLFEAARDLWRDTRMAGDAVGSRVTRGTDGTPNGALYVFADAGARDLFSEFRTGRTPIEPLVERFDAADRRRDRDSNTDSLRSGGLTARLDPVDADDEPAPSDDADDEPAPSDDPARAVYVLRPLDGSFVVVYVVRRRDGLLARTLADTYLSD